MRGVTCRIRALAAWLGMPMAISRSKRPARLKAVSSESGRLVAPTQGQTLKPYAITPSETTFTTQP